ncbi:protein ALP1-like [Senna tora]|uniref:Protein ALP1-like n=1 Tax=Senna tora TaxID=362788 RepID=A0A834WTH9_9FABA|nr:protein ALP1-like [Senna tora]
MRGGFSHTGLYMLIHSFIDVDGENLNLGDKRKKKCGSLTKRHHKDHLTEAISMRKEATIAKIEASKYKAEKYKTQANEAIDPLLDPYSIDTSMELLNSMENVKTSDALKNVTNLNDGKKNCIGAIDGTHVAAWAPAVKQTAFRGRKIVITQNVMAICDFDMMFTFVYTGWEGTTNDSRVFLDALKPTNNFPKPHADQFYLVDSGYPNMSGYLAPYRAQRYHL